MVNLEKKKVLQLNISIDEEALFHKQPLKLVTRSDAHLKYYLPTGYIKDFLNTAMSMSQLNKKYMVQKDYALEAVTLLNLRTFKEIILGTRYLNAINRGCSVKDALKEVGVAYPTILKYIKKHELRDYVKNMKTLNKYC